MMTSLALLPWGSGTLAEPDLAAALAATEMQSERIARSLHEEVIQALTAVKMDTASIRSNLDGGEGRDKKLREMSSLLEYALTCTRRAAFELRPLILDDLGLVPALESLAGDFQRRTGIACSLQVNEERMLDEQGRVGLFRIAQEWLQEEVVHTGATAARMQLVLDAHEVDLRLEHNGTDVAGGRDQPLVPAGLRARVHLLGGAVAAFRPTAHAHPCLDIKLALRSRSA